MFKWLTSLFSAAAQFADDADVWATYHKLHPALGDRVRLGSVRLGKNTRYFCAVSMRGRQMRPSTGRLMTAKTFYFAGPTANGGFESVWRNRPLDYVAAIVGRSVRDARVTWITLPPPEQPEANLWTRANDCFPDSVTHASKTDSQVLIVGAGTAGHAASVKQIGMNVWTITDATRQTGTRYEGVENIYYLANRVLPNAPSDSVILLEV